MTSLISRLGWSLHPDYLFLFRDVPLRLTCSILLWSKNTVAYALWCLHQLRRPLSCWKFFRIVSLIIFLDYATASLNLGILKFTRSEYSLLLHFEQEILLSCEAGMRVSIVFLLLQVIVSDLFWGHKQWLRPAIYVVFAVWRLNPFFKQYHL